MAGDGAEQQTLRRTVELEGVGLHSGERARVRLVPAPVDAGLNLVRSDLPGQPTIPVHSRYLADTALATTLAHDGARVGTVEHLLAAARGLGVDNLRIEVDGPEVPIVDGSAAPFAQAMLDAGFRGQGVGRTFLVIRRQVSVSDGDKSASFAPARQLRVDCTIDFKHPLISDQHLSLDVDPRSFMREVASARTFGFVRDVDRVRAMGLARGGSLDNAVVVDDFSILNPEGLRFPDEFVRHKALDALGDVALLGYPVVGAMTAFKTGHALNQKLVARVLSDAANYQLVRADFEVGVLESLEPVLAPTAA